MFFCRILIKIFVVMKLTDFTESGDIAAQLLGLTDQHIHYFEQKYTQEIKPFANSKALGIHAQMLTDYEALVTSAARANIEIKIASGFRSFERQLLIWNNKFTGKTIIKDMTGKQIQITQLSDYEIIKAMMLYSALPGASRHHWGCDIDIYADNLLNGQTLQLEPWEYKESGPMEKLSTWITENAGKFGFYLPYDSFRGGVAEEPWHLSYAPLSKHYQSSFSLKALRECLIKTDIAGKKAIIENLAEIFKRYINNVNTNNPLIK